MNQHQRSVNICTVVTSALVVRFYKKKEANSQRTRLYTAETRPDKYVTSQAVNLTYVKTEQSNARTHTHTRTHAETNTDFVLKSKYFIE